MSNFRIIFLLLFVKQTVIMYIKQRGGGEGKNLFKMNTLLKVSQKKSCEKNQL